MSLRESVEQLVVLARALEETDHQRDAQALREALDALVQLGHLRKEVATMREAQRQYFLIRGQAALVRSKDAERAVDARLERIDQGFAPKQGSLL